MRDSFAILFASTLNSIPIFFGSAGIGTTIPAYAESDYVARAAAFGTVGLEAALILLLSSTLGGLCAGVLSSGFGHPSIRRAYACGLFLALLTCILYGSLGTPAWFLLASAAVCMLNAPLGFRLSPKGRENAA